MVIRKPSTPAPSFQAAANLPYPTSPTTEGPPATPSISAAAQNANDSSSQTAPAAHTSSHDTVRRLREDQDSDKDNSIESDNEWDTDGFEDIEDEEAKPAEKKEELPALLKVGSGLAQAGRVRPEEALPSALRVGPPEGAMRKFPELQPPQQSCTPASLGSAVSSNASIPLQSHNPFLNFQQKDTSAAWSDSKPQTNPFVVNSTPVELPADQSPVTNISNLSFNSVPHEEPIADPLSPASRQPPLIPVSSEDPPPGITRVDSDLLSPFAPVMDVSSLDAFSSRSHGLPGEQPDDVVNRSWQEQQAWERSERQRQEMELAAAQEAAKRAELESRAEEEWYRGEEQANAALLQPLGNAAVPPLPPRTSTEDTGPPKPPRPQGNTSQGALPTSQEVETPGTKATNQRKEYYQIKHIRWYDANKPGIRPTPILVQNANGPCPLLALVNALVLSTPAGEDTALMKTLRTREQVTLGLLLDAVFDELMSGRRDAGAKELPDVADLYSFLITLHTGMNINPRFVRPLDGPANRNSGNFHPAVRGQAQIGGFENTREMKLYSTFNIPLVHGWLPPGESRAYTAFNRVAKTYEDANAAQFQEEDLEAKLHAEGLNEEEQKLFEDLHAIKEFLQRWPTQLTEFGLQVLANHLAPGQIAILFRNDHFSTLYKEPRSGQILTLVTDAGYSRHEEIVWESLVDVNGQGSELYSGDFRPVGNMSEGASTTHNRTASNEPAIRSLLDVDDNQGWTTVENRNRRNHQTQGSSSTPDPALMPDPLANPPEEQMKIEQEDHDLALALQLQEEEDDRHRREVADRRRRETELNEQFLSNDNDRSDSPANRPVIPPRRNHTGTSAPTPATVRRADEDAPPPTYEQAAYGRPYNPSTGHSANPRAPISGRPPSRPAQHDQSAYTQTSNQVPAPGGRRRNSRLGYPAQLMEPPGGRVGGAAGRRYSSTAAGGPGEPDKEKCVVM